MTSIVERSNIVDIIDNSEPEALLECIEQAFVSYSSGTAVVPPVGTLSFESPPGDLHIKYGYIKGESNYVIKIASGFYNNPAIGLSSSNGLNLVFNQQNGLLETILLDEGYLTDIRTALAGAVTAKHLAPTEIDCIGIIGTGIQARLQLQFLKLVTECRKVMVWGRSEQKLLALSEEMNDLGYNIDIVANTDPIAEQCNLIVTTTSSTTPLLFNRKVRPGTLIIAMGADTPGKQELDPDILKQADVIALDSKSQCKDHGEIHTAYQKGILKDDFVEIGELLIQNKRPGAKDLVVADLTGIATQDMLISKLVLDQINKKKHD